MAIPTGLVPHVISVLNVTAGVRTRVTTTSTQAAWVHFEVVGNTNTIYVGDSNVSSTNFLVTLQAGTAGRQAGYDLKPPGDPNNARGVNGGCFDLSKFYIDSAGTNSTCAVTYFQRLNDG